MTQTSRRRLAGLAGLVGFLAVFLAGFFYLMPWGCNDIGGVSSWERCTSAVGKPAFTVEEWGLDSNLNILIPVVVGLVVGIGAWWLTLLAVSVDT